MPVFDLMEQKLVKTWNFPPGVLLRFIVRTTYVGEGLFHYIFSSPIVQKSSFNELFALRFTIL